MTWANRMKLLLGLLAVVSTVAAATLVFNQRQLRVDSDTATLSAASVDAGTDYGGYVLNTFVAPGDTVRRGDTLMTLQSQDLAHDIAQEIVVPDGTTTREDGTYTIHAAVDGVVASVATTTGSYALPGSVLARIYQDDTLYLEADYVMTPEAYGRIEEAAEVQWTLPDQTAFTGTVDSLDVSTKDGSASVTAHISSDSLLWGEGNGMMVAGTPVSTTLTLRDDGPLAGVADALAEFAHRVGL